MGVNKVFSPSKLVGNMSVWLLILNNQFFKAHVRITPLVRTTLKFEVLFLRVDTWRSLASLSVWPFSVVYISPLRFFNPPSVYLHSSYLSFDG